MSGKSELRNIKKHAGIAGQYSITAEERYIADYYSNDLDSDWSTVTFVGSVYGGPIVMVLSSGQQVFVSSDVTNRIGSTLTPQWVRDFFAPKVES